MVATSVHHVIGAVVYATPWRLHAVFVSVPVVVVLLGGIALARASRAARWIVAVTALLFPIALFGAFEGVYNHGLKVLLYGIGTPHALLVRLFPPPTYQLPDDPLFEITGVLQIWPAAMGALALVRWFRARER